MFGLVSHLVKYLPAGVLAFALIFLFCENTQLYAACRGEGFMGVSTNDPIMSWVDITFSPVYSSASTSGTLGCKNWNISQFLEQSRMQFLQQSHTQLLVETVQGHGPHLEALSKLMTCPQSSAKAFSNMMWEHRQQTVQIFETAKQTPEFLAALRKWIAANRQLRNNCSLS